MPQTVLTSKIVPKLRERKIAFFHARSKLPTVDLQTARESLLDRKRRVREIKHEIHRFYESGRVVFG
jgi:hypothetical protein